jgi:hypothetical protein
MQEVQSQRVWTFGPYVEVGPEEGIQVRLALGLGGLEGAKLMQIETMILLNFRFGARIYLGGGVGIARITGPIIPAELRIPLLGLVGLRTRPLGPWTFSVEGLLLAPLNLSEGISIRWASGVLFSF